MRRLARQTPIHALVLAFFLGQAACDARPRDPSSLADLKKMERIDQLYREARQNFPEVGEITTAELLGLLESAAVEAKDLPILVDVRTSEERRVSRIPGSFSKEEFEERRDEFDGRSVVTHCTIGYRSGLYAQELAESGWQAVNLEGSILAWTHAGGQLINQDGPTKTVHVYGRDWDLAASGFQSIW